MKIDIVCASGIGDALILHIVSHHLKQAGFDVATDTPHRFGRWLFDYQFGRREECDAIFLQHDNSPKAIQIRNTHPCVYTFFGSHSLTKHGPLRPGFDFVADPKDTMAANMQAALRTLFSIHPTLENGITPPAGLIYKKHPKRVLLHTTSSQKEKNWPLAKFLQVAELLQKQGFEPALLPTFPSLEDLCSYIYESGALIGNDSGPGHIASLLQIPNLIIASDADHMRFWRPGWGQTQVLTPSQHWLPRKLKKKYWSKLITIKDVINLFTINR